jgi:hypothetical protein
VQVFFDHTIDAYENGVDDVGFGKEMEEFIKRIPANLKTNLGARVPNARKS